MQPKTRIRRGVQKRTFLSIKTGCVLLVWLAAKLSATAAGSASQHGREVTNADWSARDVGKLAGDRRMKEVVRNLRATTTRSWTSALRFGNQSLGVESAIDLHSAADIRTAVVNVTGSDFEGKGGKLAEFALTVHANDTCYLRTCGGDGGLATCVAGCEKSRGIFFRNKPHAGACHALCTVAAEPCRRCNTGWQYVRRTPEMARWCFLAIVWCGNLSAYFGVVRFIERQNHRKNGVHAANAGMPQVDREQGGDHGIQPENPGPAAQPLVAGPDNNADDADLGDVDDDGDPQHDNAADAAVGREREEEREEVLRIDDRQPPYSETQQYILELSTLNYLAVMRHAAVAGAAAAAAREKPRRRALLRHSAIAGAASGVASKLAGPRRRQAERSVRLPTTNSGAADLTSSSPRAPRSLARRIATRRRERLVTTLAAWRNTTTTMTTTTEGFPGAPSQRTRESASLLADTASASSGRSSTGSDTRDSSDDRDATSDSARSNALGDRAGQPSGEEDGHKQHDANGLFSETSPESKDTNDRASTDGIVNDSEAKESAIHAADVNAGAGVGSVTDEEEKLVFHVDMVPAFAPENAAHDSVRETAVGEGGEAKDAGSMQQEGTPLVQENLEAKSVSRLALSATATDESKVQNGAVSAEPDAKPAAGVDGYASQQRQRPGAMHRSVVDIPLSAARGPLSSGESSPIGISGVEKVNAGRVVAVSSRLSRDKCSSRAAHGVELCEDSPEVPVKINADTPKIPNDVSNVPSMTPAMSGAMGARQTSRNVAKGDHAAGKLTGPSGTVTEGSSSPDGKNSAASDKTVEGGGKGSVRLIPSVSESPLIEYGFGGRAIAAPFLKHLRQIGAEILLNVCDYFHGSKKMARLNPHRVGSGACGAIHMLESLPALTSAIRRATGGDGCVVKILDKDLKGTIAQAARETFSREIRALKRIPLGGHANIVPAFCVSVREMAIVMPRCDADLLRLLSYCGSVPTRAECMSYARQIVSGLRYIHGQGIVHGDLKANNILVNVTTKTPMICDFGMSGDVGARVVGGSYPYMSADTLALHTSGKASLNFAQDVFAVGVILHQLLLGSARMLTSPKLAMQNMLYPPGYAGYFLGVLDNHIGALHERFAATRTPQNEAQVQKALSLKHQLFTNKVAMWARMSDLTGTILSPRMWPEQKRLRHPGEVVNVFQRVFHRDPSKRLHLDCLDFLLCHHQLWVDKDSHNRAPGLGSSGDIPLGVRSVIDGVAYANSAELLLEEREGRPAWLEGVAGVEDWNQYPDMSIFHPRFERR